MVKTVNLQARAKVNLTLRLLGLRGDGYHELESVVMPVGLHDDVEVSAWFDDGDRGECAAGAPAPDVTVIPDGVDCSAIGPPDRNLCVRAARSFAARLPLGAPLGKSQISVKVVKRIPLGGGLGGGSADAAATLLALNTLAGADALGEGEMLSLAAEIGSDVPALLLGGPVLMRGRGDLVTRLSPALFAPLHVLLANPGVNVSTARAYAESDRRGVSHTQDLDRAMPAGPFHTCADYADLLVNDLETPVFSLCPEVGHVAHALREAGAGAVLMSGSGATVFALADTEEEAQRLAASLPAGNWCRITRLAPMR